MDSMILLAAQGNVTWHLLPLAIVIALVYNATRYELPEKILQRATMTFFMIMVFLATVFVLLTTLSFRL